MEEEHNLNLNNLELIFIVVFAISLIGILFVKRMKGFVYSYCIFEMGLAICVLMSFLEINNWGKIAYSAIGLSIIGFAVVLAIVTFAIKLFKKKTFF